ncbi:MAG: nucleotidyltransferase family protein [bacterium]|nr:nucleotidyltransferase family protein [bacterium]
MPREGVTLVLLAAGRAKRMGRPKLDLDIDGRTLLQRALDACARHPTIVVVSEDSAAVLRRSTVPPTLCGVVRQLHPEQGLASSARLGAKAAPADVAVGIVLADRPFLRAEIVDRTVARYREGAAEIVYPVVEGIPAHPVIFGPAMRARLESCPDGESLQGLRDAEGVVVERVAIDDPGALFDIDTEEDLERARMWAEHGVAGP